MSQAVSIDAEAAAPKRRRGALLLACVVSVALVVAASVYWRIETGRSDRSAARAGAAARARGLVEQQVASAETRLSALEKQTEALRPSLDLDAGLSELDRANRDALADVRTVNMLLHRMTDALANGQILTYNTLAATVTVDIGTLNTATERLAALANALEASALCVDCGAG